MFLQNGSFSPSVPPNASNVLCLHLCAQSGVTYQELLLLSACHFGSKCFYRSDPGDNGFHVISAKRPCCHTYNSLPRKVNALATRLVLWLWRPLLQFVLRACFCLGPGIRYSVALCPSCICGAEKKDRKRICISYHCGFRTWPHAIVFSVCRLWPGEVRLEPTHLMYLIHDPSRKKTTLHCFSYPNLGCPHSFGACGIKLKQCLFA